MLFRSLLVFPSDYDSLIAFVNTRLEPFSLDELFDNLFTHESRVIKQASFPPDMGHRIANFATWLPSSRF